MTSDPDIQVLVERALEQTAAVIAAIPAGLAGAATPCPAWDVRALVRHLTGQDLRNYQPVAMPGGGRAPLRNRADQQITELAVHSWDLVRAVSQQSALDPVLAEHALNWSRRMLRPEFRGPGQAFGPEVPVPPDAPAYERLAGWFGRDPRWTPPRGDDGRRH